MQKIHDIGLSFVYEPEDRPAAVDIVIVHGLQGHPYRTWAYEKSSKTPSSAAGLTESSTADKDKSRNPLRRVVPLLTRKSKEKAETKTSADLESVDLSEGRSESVTSVFWPKDLLPKECPHARIYVYGYDTKITNYMHRGSNKGNIFSQSKDLLYALSRNLLLDRPKIFVAHSLGGIVVKEMLARSRAADEPYLKSIVEQTAAVIFLGTPHRGSPDLAALGEWMRQTVSALRMESNSAILDSLGLKTTDLERAQEEFSGLWQTYNFRVKTFQEGRGLSGVKLGVLGNKVVPDYSSLIGDRREHAETLDANHMDMCRFSGADDTNYRKVAGEIRSLYEAVVNPISSRNLSRHGILDKASMKSDKNHPSAYESKPKGFTESERESLQSLWVPEAESHFQALQNPTENTCLWLLSHEKYQDWFHNRNTRKHQGLFYLKGNPGTGKSLLMKKAFIEAKNTQNEGPYSTAGFFFNAKGSESEHSTTGLFRSLLYQILPKHKPNLREFSKIWEDKLRQGNPEVAGTFWHESELKLFFRIFAEQAEKRIIIFIDALDECDSEDIRSEAYFWRALTAEAPNLSVCISTRHFPEFTLSTCRPIIVEGYNTEDIARYVEQRFGLTIATKEPRWRDLAATIIRKSAGVFLWVTLVVQKVLRMWDEGKSFAYLLKEIDTTPESLRTLYGDILSSVSPEDKDLTMHFFEWAVLAVRPLRLHERHHLLAFIRRPVPRSLEEWRSSVYFTENDDQLERQIRSISKGLVEVSRKSTTTLNTDTEMPSACASAGSFDFEHGETRVVQVIHESVREFFLDGGFNLLDGGFYYSDERMIGECHISMMHTCSAYINIKELDALVQERQRVNQDKLDPVRRSPPLMQENLGQLIPGKDDDKIDQVKKLGSNGGSAPGATLEMRSAHVASKSSCPSELDHSTGNFPSEFVQTQAYPANWVDVITRWRETIQSEAEDAAPVGSVRNSNSLASLSCAAQSQVLEDYPALLSYATTKMFEHARLAHMKGGDARGIVDRFLHPGCWDRWLSLKEDIPSGTSFQEYLMARKLDRWVEMLDPNFTSRSESEEIALDQWRKLRNGNFNEVGEHREIQGRKRPRSIASFSSASTDYAG